MELHYVRAAHQEGDVTVHVPSEGVLFAGDLLLNESTPMGRVGSYHPFSDALDSRRGQPRDQPWSGMQTAPAAWGDAGL